MHGFGDRPLGRWLTLIKSEMLDSNQRQLASKASEKNLTSLISEIPAAGFEPATYGLEDRYAFHCATREWTRRDSNSHKPGANRLLCQLELQAHKKQKPTKGLAGAFEDETTTPATWSSSTGSRRFWSDSSWPDHTHHMHHRQPETTNPPIARRICCCKMHGSARTCGSR